MWGFAFRADAGETPLPHRRQNATASSAVAQNSAASAILAFKPTANELKRLQRKRLYRNPKLSPKWRLRKCRHTADAATMPKIALDVFPNPCQSMQTKRRAVIPIGDGNTIAP